MRDDFSFCKKIGERSSEFTLQRVSFLPVRRWSVNSELALSRHPRIFYGAQFFAAHFDHIYSSNKEQGAEVNAALLEQATWRLAGM
ncbi:MAG: hypothetical protein HYR56_28445 [Acidobacteria bacterium]|nr:hypothetical protein [Acidobacteriota bacterium]